MLSQLRELWRYRELVMNLVMRDLKVRYKNSVLGIAWSWLNPLLMMVVFTIVFTVINRAPPDIQYYPVYILAGILPWNFFSASVVGATASIVGNGYLIKKVYFPREVLPLTAVLSSMVNFLIGLPVFFGMALVFGVKLTPWVLFVPIVLLVQVIFSVGIGLMLATLNVYYRDTQIIMEVLMLAWFFVTPIFWDARIMPETRLLLGIVWPVRRLVYILNPMASVIASYRDTMYWGVQPALDFFVRSTLTAVVILVLGYVIFHRFSQSFAEEL
jgi:homopolymeric O-antigen transport system permease protein